jgi:hypothetical protein
VFRHTSQNWPPPFGATGVTQVPTMTWQRASAALELRTQPPSATLYVLPAAPVTLYRGSQLQKLTVLAARACAARRQRRASAHTLQIACLQQT